MVIKNKSWYLFLIVTCINKEHCKVDHSNDAFRNMGFDELRYLCRIFTNKFCNKIECERCSFSLLDEKCLILNSIKKLRRH